MRARSGLDAFLIRNNIRKCVCDDDCKGQPIVVASHFRNEYVMWFELQCVWIFICTHMRYGGHCATKINNNNNNNDNGIYFGIFTSLCRIKYRSVHKILLIYSAGFTKCCGDLKYTFVSRSFRGSVIWMQIALRTHSQCVAWIEKQTSSTSDDANGSLNISKTIANIFFLWSYKNKILGKYWYARSGMSAQWNKYERSARQAGALIKMPQD